MRRTPALPLAHRELGLYCRRVEANTAARLQYTMTRASCPPSTQRELGLPVNKDIPLLAFIGRLDPQKGADILLGVAPALLGTQQRAGAV